MPPRRPTVRQALLGALLLWQAFFLVTANFAGLTGGALRRALDAIDRPWAEAACQHQVWGQYSPNVARHAIFAAVELRWPDGSATELRSAAEERDPFDYVQNANPYRVALYEGDLVRPLWGFTAETAKARPDDFRKEASEWIRSRRREIVAYLAWRLGRFRAAHPGIAAPSELVLRVHVWVTPPHDQKPWTWPPPDDVPLARFRPGAPPPAGTLPLEVWDPASEGFDYLAEAP